MREEKVLGFRHWDRRWGWGLSGDVCGATEGKEENAKDCSRPCKHEENLISLKIKNNATHNEMQGVSL